MYTGNMHMNYVKDTHHIYEKNIYQKTFNSFTLTTMPDMPTYCDTFGSTWVLHEWELTFDFNDKQIELMILARWATATAEQKLSLLYKDKNQRPFDH